MTGSAQIIQADARQLPLADDSVDLIVTSPPYLNLRSYQDSGGHYNGQMGSERTPEEFLDNLLAVTRECVRVLKPTGSIFVNLGDTYSGGRRLDNDFTAQDAAWLAGVIDSDGSISVRVDAKGRSHVAWVRVGQMRPEVVQRIGQVTGTGQVWQDKRGVWNWNAAAQQCRWVLERVWPYLYIKRRQALAAIDLMTSKGAAGRKGRWNMLTDNDLRQRELIRQAVLAWNDNREPSDYDPPLPPTVDLPLVPRWIPQKSLTGIPWRYAIRCIDDLGLILRAEVIWSKPNGLPESVTDRVRRSHEQWFMFTLQPRYFSAVDEIREATTEYRAVNGRERNVGGRSDGFTIPVGNVAPNPLGKLPGSVWVIPTEPLQVPDHLGVDHFAAFPTEWPRRIIQGWSPNGVCVECGEGRRPVADKTFNETRGEGINPKRRWSTIDDNGLRETGMGAGRNGFNTVTIAGYACACSHYHGTRDDGACADPRCLPPTTPARILDPFGGTGTTALVAKALGRHGISVDMSADYCRLAEWRVNDPAQLAKAARVEKPPRQVDGQLGFDLEGIA